MFNQLIQNIKRAETPEYAAIKNFIKRVRSASLPTFRLVHLPLYIVSRALINLRWYLQRVLWSTPIFRSRCQYCGDRLYLPNGMPWIEGNNLSISIGNDVTLHPINIAGGSVYDYQYLFIGSGTTINHETWISVNRRVTIGDNVKIAPRCFIADSNGHPSEPERRHLQLMEKDIEPVYIENNVWLGTGVSVLKGVIIGENSIISANSVVVSDIPSNVIAGGNPAKIIRHL